MGQVWERLLTREWHTEADLKTNAQGAVDFRGHKGIYEISILPDCGGTVIKRQVELVNDRETVITL